MSIGLAISGAQNGQACGDPASWYNSKKAPQELRCCCCCDRTSSNGRKLRRRKLLLLLLLSCDTVAAGYITYCGRAAGRAPMRRMPRKIPNKLRKRDRSFTFNQRQERAHYPLKKTFRFAPKGKKCDVKQRPPSTCSGWRLQLLSP